MLQQMIFIPHVIEKAFKFLDVSLDDIGENGHTALQSLSEQDKSVIGGLHSDFIEYVYGDSEIVEVDNDDSVTIHWYDNHVIIVLNEEIDVHSLNDAKKMFQTVCKDIVRKNKGDNFDSIPQEILTKVI